MAGKNSNSKSRSTCSPPHYHEWTTPLHVCPSKIVFVIRKETKKKKKREWVARGVENLGRAKGGPYHRGSGDAALYISARGREKPAKRKLNNKKKRTKTRRKWKPPAFISSTRNDVRWRLTRPMGSRSKTAGYLEDGSWYARWPTTSVLLNWFSKERLRCDDFLKALSGKQDLRMIFFFVRGAITLGLTSYLVLYKLFVRKPNACSLITRTVRC